MALNIEFVAGSIGKIYDLRTVGKDNKSVIDFSVAYTPRKRQGDEWVDGETKWSTVTAWGRLADNIAEHWNVGDRVFVYGRVDMKDGYTNKQGDQVPPRPIIIAEVAGHDNGFYGSEQKREKKSEGNRAQRRGNNTQKSAPARKPAPAPAVEDDDAIDLDLDLDDDDASDELPF